MTANEATKEKMRKLCQQEGIEVPACCDPEVETTVEDVVQLCGKLNISVIDFFNDSIFRNLD